MFTLQAIQNPNDDGLQEKAWTDVIPLVEELKKYYEFSLLLGMFYVSVNGQFHNCQS